MSTLEKAASIPKNVSSKNDLDFEYLKNLGIEYIEQLGGKIWTDYNEHDPGITMLEVLAYAITDLGNRISTPLKDLLVTQDNPSITGQFYEASDILTSEPVNALDYRKLFIDLQNVRNCWILPFEKTVYADCKNGQLSYNPADFSNVPEALLKSFTLKGLNKILIDFDPELDPTEKQLLIEAVKVKYHAHRNLCEDLAEVKEIETECVCVCAEIELESTANENEVQAKILFSIQEYLSPTVRFYSLTQMLEKGYRTDEIFDGPFLENGFIDTQELINADLRSSVRLSDLVQIISKIDGVKLIKDITINGCDSKTSENEWLICIEPGKKPVLCEQSTFSYKKNIIPVKYNPIKVQEIYDQLLEDAEAINEEAKYDRKILLPQGKYSDTEFYTTVQNDFPDTYGIGVDGLPNSASTERKSKAKQLKGYLLFFDQIFASYFAHLGKVRELLSVNNELRNTYFTQAVKNISGFEGLVEDYPLNDDEYLTDQLMGPFDDSVERRNQLIDHMLSRFAENFSEYSFLMNELYGSISEEMVLHSKQVFLKEYVELSSHRGKAFNFYQQIPSELWDTGNVSGAQKRIARLSGIKNYFRRDLCTDLLEIYPFTPSPGVTTYKWRLHNYSGTTVLSSVREYLTVESAVQEAYDAIMKIIETSEAAVELAFSMGVVNDQLIENLQVKISGAGNYYFKVVDPDISDPTEQVLAKQLLYFTTPSELKNSMLEIIEYVKFEFSEEGMFLVENIILRPNMFEDPTVDQREQFLSICADDCESNCCLDPYSFRVSVVLPGFLQRFANEDFRNFMENLIQRELPSHVLPRICWIGYRDQTVDPLQNQLLNFQNSYHSYLLAKTSLWQEQNVPTLLAFKTVLTGLNTIYPEGILEDCEGGDADHKIILGRTKLGTL